MDKLNGRMSYLCGALIITSLVFIIALCFYLKRYSPYIVSNAALVQYTYVAAFSTFGGLLSISMKLQELTIAKALDNCMYMRFGAMRMVFSILGCIAVITLVNANLAFSIINTSESKIYAILALSFLAGFSETLVPNALKKMEIDSSDKT